jgi:hypothetical protein
METYVLKGRWMDSSGRFIKKKNGNYRRHSKGNESKSTEVRGEEKVINALCGAKENMILHMSRTDRTLQATSIIIPLKVWWGINQ